MVKTSAISLRVTDALKAALEKAAEEDGRSLASYVERVLTLHLKDMGLSTVPLERGPKQAKKADR